MDATTTSRQDTGLSYRAIAMLRAVGSRVPAVLTPAGHDVVGTVPAAA